MCLSKLAWLITEAKVKRELTWNKTENWLTWLFKKKDFMHTKMLFCALISDKIFV